jgi:hypothetical protein
MTRGQWIRYSGNGLPCEPSAYVDVCESEHDVMIDIPARQAFDEAVTHWRPSPDDDHRSAQAAIAPDANA